MKLVKKLSFSLLEVILSLTLGAMLIGMLLFSLSYTARAKREIEARQEIVLKHKFIQEKLTQIFSSIDPENAGFTFKNNQLEFIYTHGSDPDFSFSKDVKATLKLMDDALILEIIANKNVRKTCLIDGLSNIEWEFLPKPQATEFGKSLVQTKWDSSDLPLSLRLTLYPQSGSEVSFAFFPGSQLPIIESPR